MQGSAPTALRGHTGALNRAELSPDGRQGVTAGDDRTVRLWDLTAGTRRILETYASAWVQTLDPGSGLPPSPDSGQRLDLGALGVTLLRFSPDGRELFILSAGEPMVRRWELETRRFLAALHGHTHSVLDLSFSPEGQRLATASVDGTVRVWELRSGERRACEATMARR